MNRVGKTMRVNPLPALLGVDDEALTYFVRRDLLGDAVQPIETLWECPEAVKLANKQLPDGAWKYPGKTHDPNTGANYYLLETYRTLRTMVEIYGFNRHNPVLQRAAAFIFSCQTSEGDIRGILGNQYVPYYHGAILELLIKAGYAGDPRVKTGLDWLLSMRQSDKGWIVPTQAVPSKQRTAEYWLGPPHPPDKSLPHAHMATGMVLRAFANHPEYKGRQDIKAAGNALKDRFFKPDKYNDRKAKAYWLKFQYPFWWTSLLTALDTLSWLGFDGEDPDIHKSLEWFVDNQEKDGLWPTGYGSGKHSEVNRRWVGLAICRFFARFYPRSK
jgi:hypothetical protein